RAALSDSEPATSHTIAATSSSHLFIAPPPHRSDPTPGRAPGHARLRSSSAARSPNRPTVRRRSAGRTAVGRGRPGRTPCRCRSTARAARPSGRQARRAGAGRRAARDHRRRSRCAARSRHRSAAARSGPPRGRSRRAGPPPTRRRPGRPPRASAPVWWGDDAPPRPCSGPPPWPPNPGSPPVRRAAARSPRRGGSQICPSPPRHYLPVGRYARRIRSHPGFGHRTRRHGAPARTAYRRRAETMADMTSSHRRTDSPAGLAAAAAAEIAARTGRARHDVAVVLGSGWRAAADALGTGTAEIPMAELPGFAAPTAAGHGGTVRSVQVGQRAVLVLRGRAHAYEGHDLSTVVHPVRTAIAAGAGIVVLTNACGGIRPDLQVGDAVLIADHLNLTGRSPLVGPQFTDLTDAYDPQLRAAARRLDPTLTEGVYAGLPGPHYETP